MKRNLEKEEGEEEAGAAIKEKKAKSVELELHGSFEEHEEQVKIYLLDNPDFNLLTIIRIMIDNYWAQHTACVFVASITGKSKWTLTNALKRGQTELGFVKKDGSDKRGGNHGGNHGKPSDLDMINFNLLPMVVREYFGKGAVALMQRMGSKKRKSIKKETRLKFLSEVAKQIENGLYPWFTGTPEDLFDLVRVKTKKGFLAGKVAHPKEVLINNIGFPRVSRTRRYIIGNLLHRNNEEYPTLTFHCAICKIVGHDKGYRESNWTALSGELLIIGGGNPVVNRIAVVHLCLDHMDGNSSNDSPENLRWLCYNCDPFTPHFRLQSTKPRRDLAAILKKEEQYKKISDNHMCQLCKRTHWTTKVDDVEHTFMIPLETDHTDGNHKNDDSSNLRRICRQCHANTPTFNKNSTARKNIQKEEENKQK